MTDVIKVGTVLIGGSNDIVIQSMVASRTLDKEITLKQIIDLENAGAGIVRLAIDNNKDVEALKWIRERTTANLCVDLQENFILAEKIAPIVEKIRYNPGHLHHIKKSLTIEEKVKFIIDLAKDNNCALRIGLNCGSVAPEFLEKYKDKDKALLENAFYHCSLMEKYNFKNFCVSIKDSDPQKVVDLNKFFSNKYPNINIHIGVTEAGMPPEGIIKTRYAFEKLIPLKIGNTLRVSLTLPFNKKYEEVRVAKIMLDEINKGIFWDTKLQKKGFNIISCPSCSRVENEKFILLAERVKNLTKKYNIDKKFSIAVMGCRVNGPGETDNTDLGLWCGPSKVNLKKKDLLIGSYDYDNILTKLEEVLNECLEN